MKIRPLTVGPIVGETTPRRARIWGRGEAQVVDDRPRRCFGAVQVRKVGTKTWGKPQFFKMNPNFDLTGLAILTELSPETRYEYEVGTYFSDVELGDAVVSEIDWGQASKGSFKTASENDQKPRTLVVGSCRYLLKTFLGSFFDDRGDKTFRSVLRQMDDDGVEIDQLIMMGDQIYADDLNVFNPDKTVRQFYRRYQDAFSQPHIRELMSRVPTYMTLDDHEIEDNWPAKATEKDWKTLFPIAIHAFQAYQLSHGPNIPIRRGRLVGTPDHFWYDYTDGCCDVFVTDSRTERYLGDSYGGREMISRQQMNKLKRWLKDESGRVKIIVTSVPFVPDSASEENPDKWSGFQEQRQEILRHIARHHVQKVVFFSGDVHASFSGELVSPSNLKIITVVSSAFFWPYPHPSARRFKLTGDIDGGSAGKFTLENFTRVVSDDNFSRVRVTPTKIEVNVFGRKGKLKHEKVHTF